MRLSFASTLIAIGCLITSPAVAQIGFQRIEIPDPEGESIEVGIWYPTDAVATTQKLELGEQDVATNAPVEGDRHSLILISHGHGGSYAGHVDTATALAKSGYVVAALTHNGDNWSDTSHAVDVWQRPRQLKLVDDFMLRNWRDRSHLDPSRIGAFGFSAGGFTVLVSAGGVPDVKRMREHCKAHPSFEDCRIAATGHADINRKIDWVHDGRIKAVVSAAPGLGFTFGKPGLANVHVPIQLWRAADDRVLPSPYYADAVRRDLPQPPEMHVVPNAGHYDFLVPCSADLVKRVPDICRSAITFDRTAFHEDFNRQVVAFFNRALSAAGQ